MDSGQVIARFEAERQALALMDHPNIAKILDGGTTADGRPYFVMELVKGTPITKYCDEHRLTPRQRLELFVPVCQALQHAHQKGIIHRDIKPSNVLVAPYDGRPVVKVIDFGVAKAAGQRLTERTLYTEFGTVVGTLEYMSPEQAELNNQDIDTRSDVYSLGVLLYELLTGTTPLTAERLKKSALLETAAGDPRGGAAAAQHPAERLEGSVARGLGPATDRAGKVAQAAAGRAGLDRHEGAGEGPRPPLRNGERPGPGRGAPPERRDRSRRARRAPATGCANSCAAIRDGWPRRARSWRRWYWAWSAR